MANGHDDRFDLAGCEQRQRQAGRRDGAAVSILAIVENTVGDERGANGGIPTSPVSRTEDLRAHIRRAELPLLLWRTVGVG